MSVDRVSRADELRALAAAGASQAEAAVEMGVSHTVVSRLQKKHGVALADGRRVLSVDKLRRAVGDMTPLDAVDLLLDVVEDLVGEPHALSDHLARYGLSPTLLALAAVLLRREGQVISYEQIIAAMFLHDQDRPETGNHYVTVQVCYLRKRLEGQVEITSHWGQGYSARWIAPPWQQEGTA